MSEIRFVDTTLRDGNQSLWALNMRTAAMVEIAEQMDRAGFESMEFFVTNMFKKYVREHKENPWDWLREGTKRLRKTELRLHGGLKGGLEKKPAALLRFIIGRVVDSGITLTRTSNCWNDYDVFGEEVADLRKLGMETVVNLIYSVSPRHTDEYYAQKAREAAAIKPYRICFKDVGGLLTPERTRALVPLVLDNIGDTPVEFHAHCNNGLAPLCYLEAVDMGLTTLHTSIPPLANGSAQPSIFNVARNLRAMGHNPLIDEEALRPVTEKLNDIARRERLPVGRVMEYDESQYAHQVPGGMISNFRHQLALIDMRDKLDAILEECVRVRKEFGYPIMVTPLSQFVGTQAAINVIVGERQGSDRPGHPVRPGILGPRRRRVHGPGGQGPDPRAPEGQGMGALGAALAVDPGGAAAARGRPPVRRGVPAVGVRRRGRGEGAAGRRRSEGATGRGDAAGAARGGAHPPGEGEPRVRSQAGLVTDPWPGAGARVSGGARPRGRRPRAPLPGSAEFDMPTGIG